MTRFKILRIACVALLTIFQVAQTYSDKPNIIYINADDYGIMDIGYNSDRYRTPNLDRLAKEGMVFTEAYAPAANCAPSRACVMSGQYGPRHGVYTVNSSARGKAQYRKLIPIKNTLHLDDEMLTIPEALKAGGYKTIHLGKWHLGEDPCTQGFDYNVGGGTSGSPYGGYFAPFKGPMAKYNKPYGKGTHSTDIFAEEAIRFMKENKKNPFFMHMAYYAVHSPIQKVPGMVEKYEGKKDLNAAYASMVEKMDESIGKIIDQLDALGLKENTLVLFSSDNGGFYEVSKQTPYRAGKGAYFEGGIREPMIVRWPTKVKAGTSCDAPVIGIDFFPTFLEAAGLPVPSRKVLDGESLMPLMTQKGTLPKRSLYWHFPIYLQGDCDASDSLFRTRPGSVVRVGKWKLHEYFEDGRLELYNLESDIGERENLAKKMPEKAKELHAMLKAWRKEIDAPVPTQLNPKYNEATDLAARKMEPRAKWKSKIKGP